MKLIFIAGPYTGISRGEVEDNISLARDMAERLVEHKLAFICPHTNSSHMHDLADAGYWYDFYITILLKCDALITVGEWQKSVGATAEVATAERHQIPIFHDLAKLVRWAGR